MCQRNQVMQEYSKGAVDTYAGILYKYIMLRNGKSNCANIHYIFWNKFMNPMGIIIINKKPVKCFELLCVSIKMI